MAKAYTFSHFRIIGNSRFNGNKWKKKNNYRTDAKCAPSKTDVTNNAHYQTGTEYRRRHISSQHSRIRCKGQISKTKLIHATQSLVSRAARRLKFSTVSHLHRLHFYRHYHYHRIYQTDAVLLVSLFSLFFLFCSSSDARMPHTLNRSTGALECTAARSAKRKKKTCLTRDDSNRNSVFVDIFFVCCAHSFSAAVRCEAEEDSKDDEARSQWRRRRRWWRRRCQ